MDIIEFWDQLIAKWNTEQKCNLCFAFEAPLFESASNIVQAKENKECCVMSLLTNVGEREVPSFSSQSGWEISVNKDYTFDIHFVTQGDLSTNNYTEIKGYTKETSRWNTIYNPIRGCLDRLEIQRELCLFTGLKVDVATWDLTLAREAYLDNNYFGWKLKVNFRITE